MKESDPKHCRTLCLEVITFQTQQGPILLDLLKPNTTSSQSPSCISADSHVVGIGKRELFSRKPSNREPSNCGLFSREHFGRNLLILAQ